MPLGIIGKDGIDIKHIIELLQSMPKDTRIFVRKLEAKEWKDDSKRWQGPFLDFIISAGCKDKCVDFWISDENILKG